MARLVVSSVLVVFLGLVALSVLVVLPGQRKEEEAGGSWRKLEEAGGSWRVAAWTGGWRRSGEEEVIIENHQETVETDFLRICRFSMKIHALA